MTNKTDTDVPRIPLVTDEVKATQTPEARVAYDRLVTHLRDLGAGEGAPRPGDPMPPFTLASSERRLVSLADLVKDGPLILSFVRGRWCPYCRAEMVALQRCLPAIRAAGARLAVVTPEIGAHPGAMVGDLGLGYDVLCDMDGGLALTLGLMFRISDEVRERYRARDLDLIERYGTDSGFLPIPATFVIDPSGIVRYAHVDPDFRDRPDPGIFLEALGTIGAGR